MVKLRGPMFSLGASGKIGGALVLSHWKGQPYARALVTPANPKSGGQTGVRQMLRFLSQYWTTVTAADKATWEPGASAGNYSPFNEYIKVGLKRNRNFLAPSTAFPAAVSDTPSPIDTFTATAGERQITIEINDTAVNDVNWGYMLYRSTTSTFTPAFDNLRYVIVAAATTSVFFVDTPLDAGTYYYDSKPFTLEGSIGALKGEINAVVT